MHRLTKTTKLKSFSGWFAIAVCGLGAALTLFLYATTLLRAVKCDASVGYEAHEYYLATALQAGANIYDANRLTAEPWIANLYTPLYTAVCAGMFALFGQDIGVCRYLSFAATLAAAFVLFRSGTKCGASPSVALACSTLFLSFIPIWFHSVLSKPDMMSLVLAATGALFLLPNNGEESCPALKNVLSSAFFFACAVLTKQSAVAPAAGAFCFLLLRARQAVIPFAAVCGGLVVVVSLTLQLMTGGFFQHVTFIRSLPFQSEQLGLTLASLGFDTIRIFAACLIILFELLVYIWSKWRISGETSSGPNDDARRPLLSLLLLGSAAFALVALGTRGSSSNQLSFTLYFLCLWLAAATRRQMLSVVIVALACWTLNDTLAFFQAYSQGIESAAFTTRKSLPGTGLKLLEDPFWYVSLRVPAVIVDCNMFSNFWRSHPIAQQPLLEMIRARRFEQIMINARDASGAASQNWTPEVVDAVRSNYYPSATGTGNGVTQVIFVPKEKLQEKVKGRTVASSSSQGETTVD